MEEKFTSRMHQMYEMRNVLRSSIENGRKLLAIDKQFLAHNDKAKNHKKWDFMLEEWKVNYERLQRDIPYMEERLTKVEKIIDLYQQRNETSEFVSYIVSLVLESIGAATEPMEPEKPTDDKPEIKIKIEK